MPLCFFERMRYFIVKRRFRFELESSGSTGCRLMGLGSFGDEH